MTFPTETPRWRRYLRFWRSDVRADIEDELAFHFQARIGELTAQGMTPDAARAQALEEFGDVNVVRSSLQTIDQRVARRASRMEWLHAWGEGAGVAQPDEVRRLWSEFTFRSGRQFWPGYDYVKYQEFRNAVAGLGATTVYLSA